MRKLLLIAAALLLGSTTIFSQFIREEDRIRDSLHIDRLIKKIPVTKDTARINYLNKLSNTIIYANYPSKTKADWVLPYMEIAYKEAKQCGYNIGVAYSLINFCQTDVYYHIYNKRHNINEAKPLKIFEAHLNELLDIALKINDADILGEAYGYKAGYWGAMENLSEGLDAQIKSLYWYKKSGNETNECEANLNISSSYLLKGEFEKTFEYCKRAMEIAKKLVSQERPNDINYVWLQQSFIGMSRLYQAAGDYESALNFLQEGRQYHLSGKSPSTWGMEDQFAELYLETGQIDSVIYYLGPISSPKFSYQWIVLGDVYLKLNKSDSALKYYNPSIDSLEIRGTLPGAINGLARSYFGKAKILTQQKNNKEALILAKKGLAMAQRGNNKMALLNIYELISKVFHQLGKNDSAYSYLVKHNELKESLLTRQFLFRLSNSKKEADETKKEARIGFLDRDNKIKEQQLKQEASLKKFLLIGLVLLLVSGIFIFRYFTAKRKNEKLQREQAEQEWKLKHLESEKKQVELQRQAAELEMQALRAQMNPHFIFNCLSSINRIIMKNDSQSASDYLTRFSRLMRMVLINSQRSMVPLEDELQMLRLYLDMERLRFKDSFNYSIIFTNTIDEGAVFVPPLLLQPFCENAIWHGLMQKDGNGHLNIELSMDNKVLQCTISDDGIGREAAERLKSKSAGAKKSMGLQITAQRLALLNQDKNIETFYSIEDIKDAGNKITGTRVNLKIDYKDLVEEIV